MKRLYPLLLISALIINCSSSTGSDPEEPDYIWKPTHTIAELIEQFGGSEVNVDTVAITGTVLSSDEEQNISNTIYITDGTAAVALSIDGDDLYQTYPQGNQVLLKASGLTVNSSNRTITNPDGTPLTFDGTEEELINTGETENISAIYLDADDLDTGKLNFYYRLVGFQFDESVVGENYVQNNTRTLRTISDQNGTELTLSFNPDASFAQETISTMAGTMYGILAVEDGSFVIKIVSFEDMQFTSPRRAPFEKRTYTLGENSLPYQIMFPRDYDENKSYPLVVFLHGAGERGSNNTSQMVFGPDTFGSFDARTDYPAIVIFPQCPSDVMWSRRVKYTNDQDELIFEFPVDSEPNYAMEMVIELVRDMITEEAVDENRIYITGLSMGGIGTFEFSYYAPDLPAAVASIAGGHDSTLVEQYAAGIDFRLYHGSLDGVVPARYSEQMYSKLDELGYQAEYFEADGRGHEWNYVLEDPEYIEWLFNVSKAD